MSEGIIHSFPSVLFSEHSVMYSLAKSSFLRIKQEKLINKGHITSKMRKS